VDGHMYSSFYRLPLKMSPVHCIETLGNKHPVTERSTLKERSSEIRRLESLKSRIYDRIAALIGW